MTADFARVLRGEALDAIAEECDPALIAFESPSSQLRTLVVDDSPVNRRLLELLLLDLGHEVIVTSSGLEAIAAANGTELDFAFIDIQLPGMNGYEVASMIRDISAKKRPMIVACSGSRGEPERYTKAGFTAVLPKPVTPERLAALLSGEKSGVQEEVQNTDYWALPAGISQMAEIAGKERIRGVLELYLKDTERRIELLVLSLKEKDMVVFARTVHSLYGSCSQMGADRLAAMSSEVENQAANGERVRLKTIVAMAEEFESVRTAISAYLAR